MNTINKKQWTAITAIIAVGLLLSLFILNIDKSMPEGEEHGEESHATAKPHDADSDEDHEHADATQLDQGLHGGAVYSDGDFKLEIVLSEEGGEPRFQIYAFDQDKPLQPTAVQLTMRLTRRAVNNSRSNSSPKSRIGKASRRLKSRIFLPLILPPGTAAGRLILSLARKKAK